MIRQSKNQSGLDKYFVRYDFDARIKGTRYRQRTVCRKSEVESLYHEWLNSIKVSTGIEQRPEMLIENFRLYCNDPSHRPRHSRKLTLFIKRLVSCYGQDIPLSSYGRAQVAQFLGWRQSQGVSPGTINKDIGYLSAFFSWLEKRGLWTDRNPIFRCKLAEHNQRVINLSGDEISTVLAKAKEVDSEVYTACMLATLAGMRRGEVLSLTWNDINFVDSTLTIRREVSKSGRPRIIPMPDILANHLREVRAGSSAVRVVQTTEGRLHYAWQDIKKVVSRIDLRYHDLRHVYAMSLLSCDVSLDYISQLLGHSSVKVTQRHYAQYHAGDGHSKVNRLGKLVNIGQRKPAREA